MNKLNYLLYLLLVLIIILLLNSIFFGENNYSNRNALEIENTTQKLKNEAIKKENEILEFEIKNAQNSNDHVENFACLLYTSPSPRDISGSRMPSSA